MIKFNRCIKNLTVSNAGGNKDVFIAIFESLTFNKGKIYKNSQKFP